MSASRFELGELDLKNVDWSRHSIGFGPMLNDVEQQERLGTAFFSQTEMAILIKLLTVPIGDTGMKAADLPNINKLKLLLEGWKAWSAARQMP